MISRAIRENGRQTGIWGDVPAGIFKTLDVLELTPNSMGLFNTVISVWCLINLPSWAKQQQAIANIASVLTPGGHFILVEGRKQGRSNLSALRQAVGLPSMRVVWHNLDLDRETTVGFLSRLFAINEKPHFGTYDLLSRVVQPLLVAPEEPGYDSKLNEIGAQLALRTQEFEDVSRVLFLVPERRERRFVTPSAGLVGGRIRGFNRKRSCLRSCLGENWPDC